MQRRLLEVSLIQLILPFALAVFTAPARAQGAANPPPAAQVRGAQDANPKADKAEEALSRTVQDAGNDRAALVRNLEDYLKRYSDTPRKAAIYRALLEASEQLHDYVRATDYSERLIAINPDDSQMMMFAAGLLERQGDANSLTRAVGYVSRVLDRVEKDTPEEKSAKVSLAEWEKQHREIRAGVYSIRGHLEMVQRNYDAAKKDLAMSYRALPNSTAALRQGEIDELQGNCKAAILHYEAAFVLPPNGPAGPVDRREVRQKLGNCWRQIHGSEAGLGEELLAAYDRLNEEPRTPAKEHPGEKNRAAKEPLAFVLRRLDGSAFPLSALKGKIVVMSFWATWCEPCREMDPMFDQVAQKFAAKPEVMFFTVNTDDDETRVQPFVTREKMRTPVLLADRLDAFLEVTSIPTVMVLDRNGKIIYRSIGFVPADFVKSLTAAVEQALRASS
jgi:thiol-disulfide isomerase/thioredoxin